MAGFTISSPNPWTIRVSRDAAQGAGDPAALGASLPKDARYASAMFGDNGQARHMGPAGEARAAAGFVNSATPDELGKLATDNTARGSLMASLNRATGMDDAFVRDAAKKLAGAAADNVTCGFGGCFPKQKEPPLPAAPAGVDTGALYRPD